jgi:hypothetical protein
MSETENQEPSEPEPERDLEDEDGEVLPKREMMSVIDPGETLGPPPLTD